MVIQINEWDPFGKQFSLALPTLPAWLLLNLVY